VFTQPPYGYFVNVRFLETAVFAMPKRKSSWSSSSKRARTTSPGRSAASHWRFPSGHPMARSGYGSVARARGAAVTGEMKYFDCSRSATALVATAATWASTEMDPSTTVDLGAAAVAGTSLAVPAGSQPWWIFQTIALLNNAAADNIALVTSYNVSFAADEAGTT